VNQHRAALGCWGLRRRGSRRVWPTMPLFRQQASWMALLCPGQVVLELGWSPPQLQHWACKQYHSSDSICSMGRPKSRHPLQLELWSLVAWEVLAHMSQCGVQAGCCGPKAKQRSHCVRLIFSFQVVGKIWIPRMWATDLVRVARREPSGLLTPKEIVHVGTSLLRLSGCMAHVSVRFSITKF